jgi:lipopolysaccharide export LptBFGC system permease protein LptF
MLHRIPFRLALPVVLAAALLPAVAFAQSQDTQSVAEAARRARAHKKNTEKPVKVITEETLDVKKGDVQSATAEQLRIPGSPETPAQPAAGAATAQGGASGDAASAQASKIPSEDDKVRGALKDRVALKEKIKDAQSDLDLLQREYQLDQDSFYSSPDYAKNTSGKEKLDAMKQQITNKQQELDQLKARLAALPAPQEVPATTPKP